MVYFRRSGHASTRRTGGGDGDGMSPLGWQGSQAQTTGAREKIENGGSPKEPFLRCVCHNTPSDQGFVPCDPQGHVQPGMESTPYLCCALCGRFFRLDDLMVLGRVHLGGIIRALRLIARQTRPNLAKQACLSEVWLHRVEQGHVQGGGLSLARLLMHPAMAALPKLAKEAGLPIELEP